MRYSYLGTGLLRNAHGILSVSFPALLLAGIFARGSRSLLLSCVAAGAHLVAAAGGAAARMLGQGKQL